MILNTQGLFEWLSQRSFKKKFCDLGFLLLTVAGLLSVYKGIEIAFDHSLSFDNTVQSSTVIQEALSKVRHKTDADVSVFYRYHNGTRGLNGFSFIKYSATDASASGTYDMSMDQNIPVTSDLDALEKHLGGQCTFVQVTPSLQSYPLFAKHRIETYSTCPVFDYNNTLIGFILIGYGSTIKLNEEIVRPAIQSAAVTIGLT